MKLTLVKSGFGSSCQLQGGYYPKSGSLHITLFSDVILENVLALSCIQTFLFFSPQGMQQILSPSYYKSLITQYSFFQAL